MKRRDFITLLGGAAATSTLWPRAALAQPPAMPLVGFLAFTSSNAFAGRVVAFRQGLNDAGYADGRNVAIEYRWAENQFDRLPALAADLVRRQVTVIVANGPPSVLAAKAQTTTIPIVFQVGEDPVKEGLVVSLNRPGGNVTGFTSFTNQLFGKRMALLREVVPKAAALALLVNPNNPNAEPDAKDAQAAAEALGLQLQVLTARTDNELETAFALIVQRRTGALLVGVDGLFFDRREQLATLTTHHRIPAIYERRDFPVAGGLMSYGTGLGDTWRQVGFYVGRILKGEKPADLPVMRSTKFELVINLRTAKALGLDIPPTLLALADEVIE